MVEVKRLWECSHAYYCNAWNYYSNDTTVNFECWDDFAKDTEGEDFDYNLVFRFDWYEGGDYDLPEYKGDDNDRFAKLWIYYVVQRKGLFRSVSINVCRNDEPAAVEWLWPRFAHLKSLWDPLG